MHLIYLTFYVLIAIQFRSSLAATCRTTNDHKNYTCSGFRFKQLTVPRVTRQQLLRVRIYDCKEKEIYENALVFPNIENLTVTCGIQDIHRNAFQNLNHLQELDLGNNTLSELPDHLFESLGELQSLNLSRNNFEKLTQNMFEGLNNLKQLIFSNNMILEFNLKVFDKIQRLEEIYLDRNQISFLPRRLFNKLRKLRHADLSYNNIKDLNDVFVPTYKLSHLNLSHNIIEDLPVRAFQAAHIEVLDLSHNKLTTIYEDSLRIDLLKEFYLQNNKISFIDISGLDVNKIPLRILNLKNNMLVFLDNDFVKAATNLVTMNIEGNPWDCKCLEKLEAIRYDLSLETRQEESEQPLCITGNPDECNVNKNNLTFYYNIFKQQLDLQ